MTNNNMNSRYIITPDNLFHRLKDLMNIIHVRLPENEWSRKEVWSKETENAFYNLCRNIVGDIEKVKSNG